MIRIATDADLLDILILGKQFLKEYDTGFTTDLELLSESITTMISGEDHLVLVLEKNGNVEGMLLGFISSPFFSRERMASELAWFLSKDARGFKESTQLIDAYEEWAVSKGCKFITMSDIEVLSSLQKLYESRGYTLMEKTYVKET